MTELIDIVERGFERGGKSDSDSARNELSHAVDTAITMLDSGEARVAEKIDGDWHVHQWLKKAVLLSFRLKNNEVIKGGHSRFYDKVPLKYANYDEQQFAADGVRVVPDAIVRRGAYVAPEARMCTCPAASGSAACWSRCRRVRPSSRTTVSSAHVRKSSKG
jgi:2,3,4,5-tetrahydropyridine-2-carboxylate N-succinyltransferase